MAKYTDSEFFRRVLNRAHSRFVTDLEPDRILAAFKKAKYLPQSQIKDIQELQTTSMRNRIILSKVSQTDDDGYILFKQCLVRSNQQHLADQLEQIEKKLDEEVNRGRPDNKSNVVIPSQKVLYKREPDTDKDIPDVGVRGPTVLPPNTTLEEVFKTNGRLIILDKEHIQQIKALCSEKPIKGGFGKVFISKSEIPGLGIRVAVKEIEMTNESEVTKMRSVTCEKLAARIMHFALVPLIAVREDQINMVYHFVSPYLEGGDLTAAISDDAIVLERGENVKNVRLNYIRRIIIMYQIASAIDYLHTEVKGFRRAVLHMDIKSANIVLDGKNNARLIDFGLAREMAEGKEGITVTSFAGTKGYFPTVQYSCLTKDHDYHNFGVVMRELLSGRSPTEAIEDGKMLRDYKNEKALQKMIIGKHALICKVWENNGNEKYSNSDDDDASSSSDDDGGDAKQTYDLGSSLTISKYILDLSIKCINNVHGTVKGPTDVSSTSLKSDFYNMLRDRSRWTEPHKMKHCEICLVNPKCERNVLELMTKHHGDDCDRKQIGICVACMRTAYLNPIICPSCDKTITTPIGDGWAAVLIAGNDCSDRAVAKAFKKDVEKLSEVLVSKSLPVMCLQRENVYTICPQEPGEAENFQNAIETAFEEITNKRSLNTLVFIFSGHKDKVKGFQLGHNEEYISQSELENRIMGVAKAKESSKGIGKVIVFLDCCYAEIFNLGSIDLVQLNACGPNQEAIVESHGSLFAQLLIQAFTRESESAECLIKSKIDNAYVCDMCTIQDELITVEKLVDYVADHTNKYIELKNKNEKSNHCKIGPHYSVRDTTSKGTIVAYNYRCEVDMVFRFVDGKDDNSIVKVHPTMYENIAELRARLFRTYLERMGRPHIAEMVKKFADIIRIEIDTGPKVEQNEHIDSIMKLNAAWISKRELKVTTGSISKITEGMVGVWFEGAHSFYKYLCQIHETDMPKDQCAHWFAVREKKLKSLVKLLSRASGVESKNQQETRQLCQKLANELDNQVTKTQVLNISFLFSDETNLRGNFLCFDLATTTSNTTT